MGDVPTLRLLNTLRVPRLSQGMGFSLRGSGPPARSLRLCLLHFPERTMAEESKYCDLLIELSLADEGSSVRLEPGDEKRADELRRGGFITGKRWVKLTDKGTRLVNQISA